MTKIHLIGIDHYELNGTKRLKKALQQEKPQILTVEASQKWLDYLIKYWDQDIEMCLQTARKNGFNKQAYSLLEDYLKSVPNYEIDVCRDYSKQKGVPLHLIDDPNMIDLLRQEILSQFQTFFDNIDPGDLDKINQRALDGVLRESVISGHDMKYSHMQDLYDGKVPAIVGEQQIIDPQRGKLIGIRDRTETRHIEELAQNQDTKIVHVGGFVHNLTDSKGETLYSRLGGLNPSRTTLLSYDR